jgi:hypothetical protein
MRQSKKNDKYNYCVPHDTSIVAGEDVPPLVLHNAQGSAAVRSADPALRDPHASFHAFRRSGTT